MKYEDIINLPRPEPHHPRMAAEARAAQFSPFAALTGYDAAIRETARFTEDRKCLDEDILRSLDDKMVFLRSVIDEHPRIRITRFLPDDRKKGGSYETRQSRLTGIDDFRGRLLMEGDLEIPIRDILDLELVEEDQNR